MSGRFAPERRTQHLYLGQIVKRCREGLAWVVITCYLTHRLPAVFVLAHIGLIVGVFIGWCNHVAHSKHIEQRRTHVVEARYAPTRHVAKTRLNQLRDISEEAGLDSVIAAQVGESVV